MLAVVSRKSDEKHRIYHRPECIYAKRIKTENRWEMNTQQAEKHHCKSCSYCGGLAGDVRGHKATIIKWEQKYNMKFTYKRSTDTLYIQTEIGFWKVFKKEELGKYVLYHRNFFTKEMNFAEAICGEFHRQVDVKATESMEKIVEYVAAHDRAKVIIMDDYRKLPKTTKKQKKYYRAAERREKKRTRERLDSIFATLERAENGLKEYSFC